MVTEAGAAAVGVARLEAVDPSAEELYRQWIAQGKHGGMAYLEKYQEVRHDPRLLLDGAQSLIVAAFSYFTPDLYRHDNPEEEHRLRWARYALGRDYHEEVRERLTAVAAAITASTGGQCRVTVDTAPLRERYWAVRAGVGFIGINNQLIVPGAGSWCVLGEIVTTLQLDADEPSHDRCSGCMKCVRFCPGKALDGKGGIDARRCMSYLTVENREEHWSGDTMPGERIYGCDICQEVCPHNSEATATRINAFRPRSEILKLTREDILSMGQEEFSRIFSHSAIKRAKLKGLQRNARGGREEKRPE